MSEDLTTPENIFLDSDILADRLLNLVSEDVFHFIQIPPQWAWENYFFLKAPVFVGVGTLNGLKKSQHQLLDIIRRHVHFENRQLDPWLREKELLGAFGVTPPKHVLFVIGWIFSAAPDIQNTANALVAEHLKGLDLTRLPPRPGLPRKVRRFKMRGATTIERINDSVSIEKPAIKPAVPKIRLELSLAMPAATPEEALDWDRWVGRSWNYYPTHGTKSTWENDGFESSISTHTLPPHVEKTLARLPQKYDDRDIPKGPKVEPIPLSKTIEAFLAVAEEVAPPPRPMRNVEPKDVQLLHDLLGAVKADQQDIQDKPSFVEAVNRMLKVSNLRIQLSSGELCLLCFSPTSQAGSIQFRPSAGGSRSRLGKEQFNLVPVPEGHRVSGSMIKT